MQYTRLLVMGSHSAEEFGIKCNVCHETRNHNALTADLCHAGLARPSDVLCTMRSNITSVLYTHSITHNSVANKL